MDKISDQQFYARIIDLLKELQYDNEITDVEWIKHMLVTPGKPRTHLLLWTLRHLCHEEDLINIEYNTGTQSLNNCILQLLSSLGICKQSDLKLIEGSSSEISQLKFWLMCLESIKQINEVSKIDNFYARSKTQDELLDDVTQVSLVKENSISLIPPDLQQKYKDYLKQGLTPLEEQLNDLDNQLNNSNKRLDNISKDYKLQWDQDEYKKIFKEQSESMNNQIKNIKLFNDVYNGYVSPWTMSFPHLELPNTGEVVHEANKELTNLEKMLNLRMNASTGIHNLNDSALNENEAHTHTIMSTLHSLANESSGL